MYNITLELRKGNHKTKLTTIERTHLWCGLRHIEKGQTYHRKCWYTHLNERMFIDEIYRYCAENGTTVGDFSYKVNDVEFAVINKPNMLELSLITTTIINR